MKQLRDRFPADAECKRSPSLSNRRLKLLNSRNAAQEKKTKTYASISNPTRSFSLARAAPGNFSVRPKAQLDPPYSQYALFRRGNISNE